MSSVLPGPMRRQAYISVHAIDVLALALTGGRERAARELGDLLDVAGFRLASVVETASHMRIVEAVAA